MSARIVPQGGKLLAVTLDEQIRRYQDLAKRSSDLRGYL